MLIGIFIPIVLGWTLGATAPRIDTAHTVRLTIEAVDDRTNQPIQAQIRVDCEDRGETPLTLPSLPIHAKISASFEESVWQRVALDSAAQRTHKLLLHFRSHDPDSSYVMVRGKMVSKICFELRELNRARKRQWDVVKGLQLVESKRKQQCGRAASGQCKQDLDSLKRLVKSEMIKLYEIGERFDFLNGYCFKPPRFSFNDSRRMYERVLL
ncbi:MAG: hypothetical protein IPK50_01660 [Fibrobacterota bacterium]|nr:MAG: hypothetical protein IPK50_01660 [Fibrobacterota bacterium]